jgi:hypothetical protein
MIRFICDTCERVKSPNEVWLLGLAAEAVAPTAARREVTILPVWDRDRAVHSLAVHFCSEKCKDRYVTRLFGDEVVEGETVRIVPRTRIKPARVKPTKIVSRRRTRRKRVA